MRQGQDHHVASSTLCCLHGVHASCTWHGQLWLLLLPAVIDAVARAGVLLACFTYIGRAFQLTSLPIISTRVHVAWFWCVGMRGLRSSVCMLPGFLAGTGVLAAPLLLAYFCLCQADAVGLMVVFA
jgi:hypothetical protein